METGAISQEPPEQQPAPEQGPGAGYLPPGQVPGQAPEQVSLNAPMDPSSKEFRAWRERAAFSGPQETGGVAAPSLTAAPAAQEPTQPPSEQGPQSTAGQTGTANQNRTRRRKGGA